MEATRNEQTRADVFLAGVIQGSQDGTDIESQSYRETLRQMFATKVPEWDVYCPFENHSSSVEYDDEQGRRVFLDHLEMVRNARLLIAYLPTASLGTSIEIWEAHNAGVPIVAISPMAHNWVLRFFTDRIFPDLKRFEDWLDRSNLDALTKPPHP